MRRDAPSKRTADDETVPLVQINVNGLSHCFFFSSSLSPLSHRPSFLILAGIIPPQPYELYDDEFPFRFCIHFARRVLALFRNLIEDLVTSIPNYIRGQFRRSASPSPEYVFTFFFSRGLCRASVNSDPA